MLIQIHKLSRLSFSSLMTVYEESNRENGKEFWYGLDETEQRIRAEQEFYQFLKQVFFPVEGAVYCIWEEQGSYVSALRLEPYRDGLLLEALETAPQYRRRGYGAKLICSVQSAYPGKKIYAHVHKRNIPSLKIHEQCGFLRISESAVYISGSVTDRCCTLCWEGKK